MSTTTASFSWTTEPSTAGVTGYIVKYQLYTDTIWTEISTSGQTISVSGLALSRIYSFQVDTLSAAGNNLGPISQAINITDPAPLFSPTSVAISLSFNNLSVDMDMYTTTIALATSPGSIIATHMLAPADTVTDTFTGLSALTNYVITITPAANQFYKQFSYNVTTLLNSVCPAPLQVSATLTA